MKSVTQYLSFLMVFILSSTSTAYAHIGPKDKNTTQPSTSRFINDCAPPIAQKDLAINNVRARLTSGADLWWDGENGGYIVPVPKPGEPEVSALFAAGIWMGGVDEGGNLKIAAQTYGRPTSVDFWSGPLTPLSSPTPGLTNAETCENWDRLFSVRRVEVDAHMDAFYKAKSEGGDYGYADLSQNIAGWPAKGNPFFFQIYGFHLPEEDQGLAAFYDIDGDGLYNPLEGDYPILGISSCLSSLKGQVPDEMTFWIFNDNGNIHAQSNGDPLQMEIQAYAFAYKADDEINNTTFLRYKCINRAIEPIDSTHFSLWVDPDLGCFSDDYIGCDPSRNMAYVYNADAIDGDEDCFCPSNVNTYCDEIPILGISLLRGPLGPKVFGSNGQLENPCIGCPADTIVELGMSSFTYYIRDTEWGLKGSPNNAQEYFHYMTGSWRDGSPFEYGGDGYQENTYPYSFAYPDPPNDPDGWSMCTGGFGGGPAGLNDLRFVQSSGSFRLNPGAVNELIYSILWVPDQNYPCPSLDELAVADDKAIRLFNDCFDTGWIDYPDAPDVDIIELDQEIILLLSNDKNPGVSNNAFESFKGDVQPFYILGDNIPEDADFFYDFEGYQLFQVARPDILLLPENIEDPKKVRLIAQVDLKNEVRQIFNWKVIKSDDNPTGEQYWVPELKVEGNNEGIHHSFRIVEDAFAEGDRRLINHKKYYFVAIAYAHNEFTPFNPELGYGQLMPYIRSLRNIGPLRDGRPYTAIPRPILSPQLNAQYGDGVVINRLDGLGTGSTFLDLSEETKIALEAAFVKDEQFEEVLTYSAAKGPIDIKVFNPLAVKDGTYEVKFVDSNIEDDLLDADAHWQLRALNNPEEILFSDHSIERLNEQIIRDYGFAISIEQVGEAGAKIDTQNGFIGYDLIFDNDNEKWLGFIPEGLNPSQETRDDYIFDFLSTNPGETDAALDPNQGLSAFGNFAFMPYTLLDFTDRGDFDAPFLGPVWTERSASAIARNSNKLEYLNNVDIVFTSDKNLWSRCVIVETASRFYNNFSGITTEPYIFDNTPAPARQFDLRPAPSVSKQMGADGLPIPDANPTDNAYGMGWFPGYAVDVETGQRLNIFFGENSIYNGDTLSNLYTRPATGGDMMFNPTDEILLNGVNYNDLPLPYVLGGQHYVYVTRRAYDGCAAYVPALDRPSTNHSILQKINAISEISWAGTILLQEGEELLSYEDGLIPTKTTVKLRVNNPYQVEKDDDENGGQPTGTGENNYHPMYRFTIEGLQAGESDENDKSEIIDAINIVPNPYYGFSEYETATALGVVKITNLPAKCTISIYSLEGQFIRQYERNEVGTFVSGNNRAIRRQQIIPDLEWDLKNHYGVPISSGVFLIHIAAEGIGEKTLKWFGVNRKE